MTIPTYDLSPATPDQEGADPNLVTYRRPELRDATEDLDLMEDLLGGTRRMWRQSTKYIRKWADEHETTYHLRRKSETVFGGLSRTLAASVGMLFAKEPTIEWNAGGLTMEEQWANVDARGTHGDVFVKHVAQKALRDGFSVGLVDHPSPPPNTEVTSATEKALGLRPRYALYPRKNVLSWRTATIANALQITQLVLLEPSDVEDGNFGVINVKRFRVLRLLPEGAAWALYQQIKPMGTSVSDFTQIGSGYFRNRKGEIASALPIGVAYAGISDAPLIATFPLLDVAFANLAHWQLSTDRRFYLSLSAYPQPVISGDIAAEPGQIAPGAPIGLVPGKVRLGPGVVVRLKEGGTFTWAELQGSSIQQLSDAIDGQLHAMAKLGASFLMKDIRGVETAESKRLDSTAENASLVSASRGIEDGINQLLRWHAWYLGIDDEASAPKYTLNRDFDSTTLDSPTMLAYVQAVKDAGLPVRILLEAWQGGGRISPDEDLDALEMEMEASLAAAKQAALDAQATMLAGQQGGGPTPDDGGTSSGTKGTPDDQPPVAQMKKGGLTNGKP